MPLPDQSTAPETREREASLAKREGASPLVSCYAYCGGFRWHWLQTHDSFPGQPVVLVHGPVMPSPSLVPLAEAVARWAPVFVPDLPGYGLSGGTDRALSIADCAAALAEWMALAGACPAHVVGCSFGGQIAAELAARFPQRLRSLTLVGPVIDPAARNLREQAARWMADISEEPRWFWLDYLRSCAHEACSTTFGVIRAVARDRIETKLPSINLPTLILRGLADPVAPAAWVRYAARLAPDAAAMTLPQGAHYVYFTHPGTVSKAIRKFTFPMRNRAEMGAPEEKGTVANLLNGMAM